MPTRSPDILNCVIEGNSAAAGGGVICLWGAAPTLEDCRILQNVALYLGGGAVLMDWTQAKFLRCEFDRNSVGPADLGIGGGLFVSESASILQGCRIIGNTAAGAESRGGGIYIQGASAGSVDDTLIAGNSCVGGFGNGGGVCVTVGVSTSSIAAESSATLGAQAAALTSSGPAQLSPAAFSRATAPPTPTAGGMRCWEATPTLTSCEIRGNDASWGGGVQCYTATPTLVNCLVVGNAAEFGGGGVNCQAGSAAEIVHCIVADNLSRSGDGGGLGCLDSQPVVRNSIIWGNDPNSFCNAQAPNLTGEDPLFVERGQYLFDRNATVEIGGVLRTLPDFVVRAGDYRPTPESPAVDAAAPADAPETDLLGNRRCGDGPDVGAYEHQAPECERVRFRRGDVNADGTLNVTDPVVLLNFLFLGGESPACLNACDSNDDETADLADAVATLRHLFLGDPDLPPPFRDCGTDATVAGDALTCATFPGCAAGGP